MPNLIYVKDEEDLNKKVGPWCAKQVLVDDATDYVHTGIQERFPCLIYPYIKTVYFNDNDRSKAARIITGCIHFHPFEMRMVAYPYHSFKKRCVGLEFNSTFVGSAADIYVKAYQALQHRLGGLVDRELGLYVGQRQMISMIIPPPDLDILVRENPICVIKTNVSLDRLDPFQPELGHIGRIGIMTEEEGITYLQETKALKKSMGEIETREKAMARVMNKLKKGRENRQRLRIWN